MVKITDKSRCPSCKKNFKQLKRHFSNNPICKQYVLKETLKKEKLYGVIINGKRELQSKSKASISYEQNPSIQTCTTSVNEDDEAFLMFNPDTDNKDEDLICKRMEYIQN